MKKTIALSIVGALALTGLAYPLVAGNSNQIEFPSGINRC
jgi:hypothetical protein